MPPFLTCIWLRERRTQMFRIRLAVWSGMQNTDRKPLLFVLSATPRPTDTSRLYSYSSIQNFGIHRCNYYNTKSFVVKCDRKNFSIKFHAYFTSRLSPQNSTSFTLKSCWHFDQKGRNPFNLKIGILSNL